MCTLRKQVSLYKESLTLLFILNSTKCLRLNTNRRKKEKIEKDNYRITEKKHNN